MLTKYLPYISLALAVWLTFCPDAREYLPEIRITPRGKERRQELNPVERLELFAEWSRLQAELSRRDAGPGRDFAEWKPASVPDAAPVNADHGRFRPETPGFRSPGPDRAVRQTLAPVDELSLVPANPPMKVTPENSRFKPVKTKLYDPPERPAPPPVRPAGGDRLFHSLKQARLTPAAHSAGEAMAAMPVTTECEEEFMPLSAVSRRGRAVPFYAAAPYPELPAKGIYVWGDGKVVRESQTEYDNAHNPYRQSGAVYSLGIKKDWSVDSVIGASVDVVDTTVKSRVVGDFRENDINGFILKAHYDGTFLGKYPISLTGFYGRFDHKGAGQVYRQDIAETWREDDHRSELYGGSARIGLPLLVGNGFRVLPELGVEYKELHGRGYTYSQGDTSVIVPEVTSKSFTMPLTVTVRKDFLHPWGVFTPHVKAGYVKEFDESAIGVRTFNSSSIIIGNDGKYHHEMAFNTAYDKFYQVGAGFTARTVGGWEVAADYQRRFVRDWHDDMFTFELGRNF